MYNYTPDPNVVNPHRKSQEDNPFGKYTQMTYPIQENANIHNFGKAFQERQPMIERQNFKNQNNVWHNNLNDNLQSEFV